MNIELFCFKDTIDLQNSTIEFNILEENVWELKLKISNKVKKVYIYPNVVLHVGRCLMVLYSPLTGELFTHYGYNEVCQTAGMSHSQMLKTAHVHGLMQVSRVNDDTCFVKAFLPKGQMVLNSTTNDWSDRLHVTSDCINPIDWQYSPTFDVINGHLCEDNNTKAKYLKLEVALCDASNDDIYITYAGQYIKLEKGSNLVIFDYVPGENAFIGLPFNRQISRMIEIDKVLMKNHD